MQREITSAQLENFREKYDNVRNTKLENSFKTRPIVDVCFNKKIFDENKFEFNIDLEEGKVYNQRASLRCWLFSCLNLIKNDVAHNLDMNLKDFELSANFLSFYDKLEKSNFTYQTIIEHKTNLDIVKMKDRFLAEYLKDPVRENGRLEYARELIKKYGLVPYEVMPETPDSVNSETLIKAFSQKVRCDLYELIAAKKEKKRELYEIKNRMLEENYVLLSTLFGQPPKTFNFSYFSKDGKKHTLRNITPIEFYQKFCSINLDDFVLLGNVPQTSKPFFKKYRKLYKCNIIDRADSQFVNLPIDTVSDLCVKQLQSGLPVCFSCDNRKYRASDNKVLDTRLLGLKEILNIEDLNKQQAMDCFDSIIRHWMIFRGVHVENKHPIRWKVEDSKGDENGFSGYYVMNNNFFEKCVFNVWIHKKFIPEHILKLNNKKSILYGYSDSI